MDAYTKQFDPYRDDSDWVIEDPELYSERMKESLLPDWPSEVLIEWLHRHACNIYKYSFLKYEKFQFDKQLWPLSKIPGNEVFDDPSFFQNFSNIHERAKNEHDWLAKYMMKNGTWNTPLILLDNTSTSHYFPDGSPMRSPYHLLEGHRRLSLLNGLCVLGKANQEHNIWIVTIDDE